MDFIRRHDSLIKGRMPVINQPDTGWKPLIKGNNGNVADERFLYQLTNLPTSAEHIDVISHNFTFEYTLSDTPVDIDRFVLIGFDGFRFDTAIREFDLYISEDGNTFSDKNLYYHYSCRTEFVARCRSTCDIMLDFEEKVKTKTVGIAVKNNPEENACHRISHIGIYSDGYAEKHAFSDVAEREITVKSEVTVEDFYGIGGCVLPMALMDRSLEQGYNLALWQEEKRRTNLCPASVVRVWFQPDWFIIDKESYYRHEYDFDSPRMKAFYAYLDSYREAGVEVLLNYGWKVDKENQSWFSIPSVRSLRESAPQDLDEFAVSCAEFLYELCEKRGYSDVVKYLTFYNEPCTRDIEQKWIGDFLVAPPAEKPMEKGGFAEEKFDYWYLMALKTENALKEKGLDGKIKIWGAECAGENKTFASWLRAFEEKEKCPIDVYTVHRYHQNSLGIKNMRNSLAAVSSRPTVVSEFATTTFGKCWDLSNVQMVMSFIENGFAGAFLWIYSGVTLTSPATFSINAEDENMWHSLHTHPDRVNNIFYELCLFMRYVPVHSKALKTVAPVFGEKKIFDTDTLDFAEIDDTDIRAVSFITPDGDLVIAVETDYSSSDRHLKIKLPDNEDRIFNKFSVGIKEDLSVSSHIPYLEKTVASENGFLCDEIRPDYALTFYTTAKPYGQIICDKKYTELKKGENFSITYTLHDTPYNDVRFSVAEGESLISLDKNTVTVKDGEAGETAAVKVTLADSPDNCYDIVLIKII